MEQQVTPSPHHFHPLPPHHPCHLSSQCQEWCTLVAISEGITKLPTIVKTTIPQTPLLTPVIETVFALSWSEIVALPVPHPSTRQGGKDGSKHTLLLFFLLPHCHPRRSPHSLHFRLRPRLPLPGSGSSSGSSSVACVKFKHNWTKWRIEKCSWMT